MTKNLIVQLQFLKNILQINMIPFHASDNIHFYVHFYRIIKSRYIKVKVENYLLFMFSPPKISWVVSGTKYICLHLLPVFYLIQPSSKQIICFDIQKQNSVLPIVFYVHYIKYN